MKKIVTLLTIGCLALTGCGNGDNKIVDNSKTESLSNSELDTISNIDGFEKADYEKYNSYASENGLDGTLIYVEGLVLSQTKLEDTGDDVPKLTVIIEQDDGNRWCVAVTSQNEIDAIDGKEVRVFGTYIGYSDVFNLPTIGVACSESEKSLKLARIELKDDGKYEEVWNYYNEYIEPRLSEDESLNSSSQDNNPYQNTVDQMKELYIEEADGIENTQENSDGCFEIVLKTSKELIESSEDYEELVYNDLFTPFTKAAGYLCKHYDESTEYGRVGDLAFDLIAYATAEDEAKVNEILSEFESIADKHGWEIVTLDESKNTSKNTESSSIKSDESQVEIIAEYTLSDGIGWYTRHFMIVKNNSDVTVDVSTSSLAYSSDGTMIAAADGSLEALGAGCTSVLYEAFETENQINHYDTTINVSESEYYESVIQDLEYVQNNIDGGAIFQVTNNGEKPSEFVEGYALYFLGDQLVDYQCTYFVDDDSEIKPGATISKQLTAYEDFDRIEFYLAGRRSTW